MSLRYLLDTNIVSAPFRPRPPQHLLDRLAKHQLACALPTIVWHELRYGCALLPDSRRRRALERYLRDIVRPIYPLLGYDEAAADWHAAERARLTQQGRTPPLLDGQIAAIAAVHRLVLVTDNQADFERFEGLPVENWLEG